MSDQTPTLDAKTADDIHKAIGTERFRLLAKLIKSTMDQNKFYAERVKHLQDEAVKSPDSQIMQVLSGAKIPFFWDKPIIRVEVKIDADGTIGCIGYEE